MEEGADSIRVSASLKIYKKFVDAVILLMKQQITLAMQALNEIAQVVLEPDYPQSTNSQDAKQKSHFKYLVLKYRAYGFIIKKQYQKATEDLEMVSGGVQFDQASKFNLSLAKLLQNKTHEDDKLDLIKTLQREFPDNKDVIRYHAIFLIQK